MRDIELNKEINNLSDFYSKVFAKLKKENLELQKDVEKLLLDYEKSEFSKMIAPPEIRVEEFIKSLKTNKND